MPVLKNAKQERFAQNRASGMTATKAYTEAGYGAKSTNDGNRVYACKMNAMPHVAARVAEILGRAAKRTEISIATVTDNLLRIAAKAEELGEASGLSVAKGAHMDVAKINGLVVDKKEIGAPGDFANMSDNELARIARSLGSEGIDTPPATTH
jgi:phage terminase small subunit